MGLVLFFKAALMGMVEGMTEFLPVSSTGHLILADAMLNFGRSIGEEKAHVFEIGIQSGAILAVMLVYLNRLSQTLGGLRSQPDSRRLSLNLVLATAPVMALGLALGPQLLEHLYQAEVVAAGFIGGGLLILVVEFAHSRRASPALRKIDHMSWREALQVGLAQCLALIPGTSRAAATIAGGMVSGLSRQSATEFSVLLGIPTLVGAASYKVVHERALLSSDDLTMFSVGLVFAFLSAWLGVRWLIRYVSNHSLSPFAWYRIAFGALILASSHYQWIDWTTG